MKPHKHLIGAFGIILAAIGLIALTWFGTLRAIQVQRQENAARVSTALQNEALTLSGQINRQLLALDQTLRMLVSAWEAAPDKFDLESWRSQAVVLNGISRDMLLADENGIVRQSSVNPAVNADVSQLDFFADLSAPGASANRLFIGAATIGAIMRQWHMNVARALHHPDGSFAGVIDADYRIAAITDVFGQTDLGRGGFATLVGLDDGKMRGTAGPASLDPDVNIADTRMFAAIQRGESGEWIGPTATDPVQRIHAYRHIPNRPLVLIVAMDEAEAMRPAASFRQQGIMFAGSITALLIGLAALLLRGSRLSHLRERAMAEDRAILAAANAQLEVARAQVTAKAERLEATLTGMTDGVSMFDGHLRLVEWNAGFPDIAGVPPEMLRVGLPMEEVVRAQIASGQFGRVTDPEDEIERRIARVRAKPSGVLQRQTPDGRTLELRRNKLPDGGFVTLYADITSHKQIESDLRAARAEAEAANAAKSRFVAVVSHEIRTPLDTLLNTVRLLGDGGLSPQQQSLLALARQSGDALFGLINDILEMSQLEAGKLVIRPSLFDVRQLLDSSIKVFEPRAAERGIALHVAVAEATPATLLADPGRLRQVLLNLLSNALKYARPGDVWLTAEPADESRAVTFMVKDSGPIVAPAARDRLFQPFSRLDGPETEGLEGTGLGLSICHLLVTLMGGETGCDPWIDGDERTGNAFWVTLPASALPFREIGDESLQAEARATIRAAEAVRSVEPEIARPDRRARTAGAADRRRPLPRTRVLLADDVLANQLVTATLLRREGHMVDVVSNGRAAVDAVKRIPYDLILMDVFMPEMGGQEASRVIRLLPEPASMTPIVALTGNLAAEEEEAFEASGMDGVLCKPVSLPELLDALRSRVWSVRRQDPECLEAPGAGIHLALHDPWAVLSHARIRDLRANLPPETFVNLVEECVSDLDHRLPALHHAVRSGNMGAIIAHAHAMVGMAANHGMAALETTLRTILAAAHDGDTLTLSGSVVAEVEADLAEAARMLREVSQSENV